MYSNRDYLKLAPALLIISLLMSIIVAGAAPADDISVLPSMVVRFQTPIYFSVKTVHEHNTAYDPMILLVMTEESYNALTDVDVEWTGEGSTFVKADFQAEDDGAVELPPEASDEAGYIVASLKERLETEGPIYWASGPFINQIANLPVDFTVTLHSSNPAMLVYVLGKSGQNLAEHVMRTPISVGRDPPTFSTPEPATILGVAASMTALAGYAIRKRKLI